METILVVGASGNIGVSVIIAALRVGFHVLAVVRNQSSAEKLFKHVGTKEGITTVEADVLSDNGISGVVEQVKAGKLPDFQHVHASVGVYEPTTPIQDLDMKAFRNVMHINFEANYLAYKATVPYLLEKGHPNASWTMCTGGAGDFGVAGVTAVSQGALFSLANVACRENQDTNIRFNEVYLNLRVDFDSVAEEPSEKGVDFDSITKKLGVNQMKASAFARVYEKLFADKTLKGGRITVAGPKDVDELRYKSKLEF